MIIAGLETQDSAFFAIKSNDVRLPQKILNEDIISFNYTEECGRHSAGSLVLNDPNHYYSNTLRFGAELEVSFGYTSPDISVNAGILQLRNVNQIAGGLARTGVRAYIANPAGKAETNGRITYSCNFYGSEMLADQQQFRTHTGMTKSLLIETLLAELGVLEYYVDFTRGAEILDRNTQITQRETNYRLLLRLAREWRCIFRISNSPAGYLTAIFISPQYIGQSQISSLMGGAIAGDSIFLEYQEGVANVLEYSWKNHMGSSGTGDNCRIVPDGRGGYTFVRYVTSGDTVQAYVFRPERVRARIEAAGDFAGRMALLNQYRNADNFADVRWAFDPVRMSTAPQGLGYSMQVKMLGMPLMSAPLKVLYGEGFPDWFTPASPSTHVVNYYARRVTHTIDASGYKMDLDVCDGFTLTGGSLI